MHSTRLGYHFLLFYGQCYFSFVLVFFFWCVFFVYTFLFFFCFFFFFSSRRRHTRSKRDWSSDVCSSDLNFFTIRDVLKRYDGETIRFFMLRTHYRSPLNFADANLDDARNALRRLYTALDAVAADTAELDWTQPQAKAFRDAMNEDFNTPGAVAVL